MRPTTDVNHPFVFDYFVKDHLGNVRMTLTDEQKVNPYAILTFEDQDIDAQNAQWDNKNSVIVR